MLHFLRGLLQMLHNETFFSRSLEHLNTSIVTMIHPPSNFFEIFDRETIPPDHKIIQQSSL